MATRVTDGARRERHEKRETTRKARENGLSRSSDFLASELKCWQTRHVKRDFRVCLKKKRDCSQSIKGRAVAKITNCWVYAISSQEIEQLGSSFDSIFLLFPMKVAKDQIASRSRGHSRPPCDSPSSSRYFFFSNMAYCSLKVLEHGQQKCTTCFATFLQNGLKSDVRFTTHESHLPVLQPLGCEKVFAESREKFFLQQNLCMLHILPAKANLFCSKWLNPMYGMTPT